jgi:uncharacterized protein YkwD
MLLVFHGLYAASVTQVHSADDENMCSREMSHDGSDQRCDSLGWDVLCFENVAWNTYEDEIKSAEEAMTGYWGSPSHMENILQKDVTKGGVGQYKCSDGKTYYTALCG